MKWIGLAMALVAPMTLGLASAGTTQDRKLVEVDSKGSLAVYAVSRDVVKIQFTPTGLVEAPTPIMDLDGLRKAKPVGKAVGRFVRTPLLTAELTPKLIRVVGRDGATNLSIDRTLLESGTVQLDHSADDNLYGMRGCPLFPDPEPPTTFIAQGLLRNRGARVSAGSQGDGGAPIAYSTKWGLFVDSVDGEFTNTGSTLQFKKGSRKDVELYVILGSPKRTIGVVTDLTGHAPMVPKWSLGFMNSQWGSSQAEIYAIADEYRKRQIPIDAFILDFDFKAWGEDEYGEWRWNSSTGKGNFQPNKFPDGQSGKFAKTLLDKGIRLVGIMKPRILVENEDKTNTKAAAEALAHNWFLPNQKPYTDYFSRRPANDLDFSKKDVRTWYWDHAQGLYKSGIVGWWNDEADEGFDSLGFFHMQQSLYEGQRSISDERVWSINRNWYLGAQRYAFGTWSGDIDTGFQNLAIQPLRMLSLTDLDQTHWSMDSGGFNGHPTPENYARWLQCASVVPIMRVHGTFSEHRQPWVYGPVAEAAAKKAIELRYQLIPYLYSFEREARETGAGIVRPLFWEFPNDPLSANVTDSWMVGDAILAAPVLKEGQSVKSIYLPPGDWVDFATGESHTGGKTIEIAVDSTNWSDLPLFVRGGSIVAMNPVVLSTADSAQPTTMSLHVYPDEQRVAHFRVYDDDGKTYASEKGAFFVQNLEARVASGGVRISFSKPLGRYVSATKTYKVVVHRAGLKKVVVHGRSVPTTVDGDTVSFEIPAGVSVTALVR